MKPVDIATWQNPRKLKPVNIATWQNPRKLKPVKMATWQNPRIISNGKNYYVYSTPPTLLNGIEWNFHWIFITFFIVHLLSKILIWFNLWNFTKRIIDFVICKYGDLGNPSLISYSSNTTEWNWMMKLSQNHDDLFTLCNSYRIFWSESLCMLSNWIVRCIVLNSIAHGFFL